MRPEGSSTLEVFVDSETWQRTTGWVTSIAILITLVISNCIINFLVPLIDRFSNGQKKVSLENLKPTTPGNKKESDLNLELKKVSLKKLGSPPVDNK